MGRDGASTGPQATPYWESLRTLGQTLLEKNPFYRAKLRAAQVEQWPESPEEFFLRVPFTTKDELVRDQASHPPYGTDLTFPIANYTRCHQTSGTHGSPLRWLDTAASWSAMTEDWVQVFRNAGVHSGDRILFAFSFGPFLGFWLAFEAGQSIGALCLSGGGMNSALRLRILLEHQCTVVCCTPTYALHLAESAAQLGANLSDSSVRTLVVAGEPGGSQPAMRERLSRLWNGARVFDHHGMTETGPVTSEVPDSPGQLRVFSKSFLAEILHPTTQEPVAVGETGELVLTTLQRLGSPLIRYRTGDLVRRATPQGSMHDIQLDGGILGRLDDMVIVRGVNVYPGAIEEVVRTLPEIAEYRVTLDQRGTLPELGIEIEADHPIAEALAHRLRQTLSLRVPVKTVSPGTLPRFEHKAQRWQKIVA